MTRQIAPDDAHSIAPDVGGDVRAQTRGDARPAAKAEEPDRPPQHHAPAAPLDHATIRAIVAGIMLAMFLSALEQTIVAPALPAIGKSLGGIDDLSWIVTAYLLAATAATPLFGKLSDIYGRRALLLAAIVIFVAGSVACALAPTIWVLILSRALQGIGGGGLLPIAQTIIADLLSPRERPVVQGRTSIMFMSASILGPVLGGLLTDHLHWSFIFWINLPLGAVALVMTERALRRLPRNHRPHQLDVIGAALMVGAALALMLALSWGGVRYPWSSSRIVTLVASSGALWVLFTLRLLTAREPFIPLAILHGRVTSTITVARVLLDRHHHRRDDLHAALLPDRARRFGQLVRTGADRLHGRRRCGSQVTTRVIVRIAHYMRVPMLGLVVAIIVLLMLGANPAGYSIAKFVALLFALGFGFRADVSDEHHRHAERGQTAPARHRDRHAELFPHARRRDDGRDVRRHCARRHRRRARRDDAGKDRGRARDLAPAFHWVFIAAAIRRRLAAPVGDRGVRCTDRCG